MLTASVRCPVLGRLCNQGLRASGEYPIRSRRNEYLWSCVSTYRTITTVPVPYAGNAAHPGNTSVHLLVIARLVAHPFDFVS